MSSTIIQSPKRLQSLETSTRLQAESALYRLTVDQYHDMAAAGILLDGEPVELLDGLLVRKMVKNAAHRIALNQLRDCIWKCALRGWHIQIQDPITLDDSEPEPDLSIIRGATTDYPDGHPRPRDVGLVIEVAESSLHDDRELKRIIYARNGIAEYWIVNLVDRQVEVYHDPTGLTQTPCFRSQRVYAAADSVPLALGGVQVGTIPVAEILP